MVACAPAPRDIRVFSLRPAIPAHSLPAKVLLGPVDAAPIYLGQDIAYRLSYADDIPHPYANSRWRESPIDQLADSLRAGANGQLAVLDEHPQRARYILNIELVAYDHVFTGAQRSYGEIRLNCKLTHLHSHDELGHDTLHIRIPALSADARGGAMALEQANHDATVYILDWLQKMFAERGIEGRSY